MLHKVVILFEASYNYIFWTLYLRNDFVSKSVLVIFNPSFLIFNKSHERNFWWCLQNEYSEHAYGSDRTDIIPTRFKPSALAFAHDNSNSGARKN